MRPPDEIKKGLECKTRLRPGSATVCDCQCYECDVYVPGYPNGELWCDALAYIQQLESRLAQTERERDAAVKIIEDATTYLECFGSVKFALKQLKKLRGVCEENVKED